MKSEFPAGPVNHHEPGIPSARGRVLGNEFRRQAVVEFSGFHFF